VSVRALADQMVLVEGTPPADGKFVVCSARWHGYQPESSHPSTFVMRHRLAAGRAAAARADSLRRRAIPRQADGCALQCPIRAPLDRTKLSKSMASEPVLLRTAEHYAQHDIELMLESPSRDAAARSFLPAESGGLQAKFTRRVRAQTPSSSDRPSSRWSPPPTWSPTVPKSVTVLARDPVPFKALFGEEAGKAARRLHESKGVKFVIGELQSFASDAQGGLRATPCSALRGGHRLHAQHALPAPAVLLAGGKPGQPAGGGPGPSLAVGLERLWRRRTSSATGTGRRAQTRAAWRRLRCSASRCGSRSHLLLDADVRHRLPRTPRLAPAATAGPRRHGKRAVVAEPKEEFKFMMTYLVGEADQVVAGVAVGAPGPVHRSNSGPAAGTLPVMQQQQQQPPRSSRGPSVSNPANPAGRPAPSGSSAPPCSLAPGLGLRPAQVSGQIVLVTGAAQGIGLATAELSPSRNASLCSPMSALSCRHERGQVRWSRGAIVTATYQMDVTRRKRVRLPGDGCPGFGQGLTIPWSATAAASFQAGAAGPDGAQIGGHCGCQPRWAHLA
uniref:PPM-type phosphatase domain-containing protein n=1 Tax=Macrostomum lignano TaxID=282301 RepID=A0A1I8FBV4_9PLAT